ncbi:MAG: hypothetical protein M3305_02220 [Actinomycetota bacterium]|nr:hypothetical protein [Actinomycetota bacterium]
MQNDRIRDDAPRLLRAAYERRRAVDSEGPREAVGTSVVAYRVGQEPGSRYYDMLMDYRVDEDWLERNPTPRDAVSVPSYLITERGLGMLDES